MLVEDLIYRYDPELNKSVKDRKKLLISIYYNDLY